jgi:hypothetical protein
VVVVVLVVVVVGKGGNVVVRAVQNLKKSYSTSNWQEVVVVVTIVEVVVVAVVVVVVVLVVLVVVVLVVVVLVVVVLVVLVPVVLVVVVVVVVVDVLVVCWNVSIIKSRSIAETSDVLPKNSGINSTFRFCNSNAVALVETIAVLKLLKLSTSLLSIVSYIKVVVSLYTSTLTELKSADVLRRICNCIETQTPLKDGSSKSNTSVAVESV